MGMKESVAWGIASKLIMVALHVHLKSCSKLSGDGSDEMEDSFQLERAANAHQIA